MLTTVNNSDTLYLTRKPKQKRRQYEKKKNLQKIV